MNCAILLLAALSFTDMEKQLQEPQYASNKVERIKLVRKLVEMTKVPGWTAIRDFDWNLRREKLPTLVPMIVDSHEYTKGEKLWFVRAYAEMLAGEERYDEAYAYAAKYGMAAELKKDLDRWSGKTIDTELPRPYVAREHMSAKTEFPFAFLDGDWEKTAKLYPGAKDIRNLRMYVIALANLGRLDEARKAVAEGGDDAKLKILGALLGGKDPIGVIGKDVAEKDRIELVKYAGSSALLLNRSDAAEKLDAYHRSLYAPHEERILKVGFSEKAIDNLSVWRAMADKLPKGVCDIPFGVKADQLVTDINVSRNVTADDKATRQPIEITSVCDRYALHIFIRVADPEARKVENGFSGGTEFELYFAPGAEAPYVCFGLNPTRGINFDFHTSYTSRDYRRVDLKGGARSGFKQEIEFTDTDYVFHLRFDWSNFYQRLPTDGEKWKFEVLAWTSAGGFTWGGSRGVHRASDWGSFVFALDGKAKTAIRRQLILNTYKSWQNPPSGDSGAALAYFDRWRDPVYGDPVFYEKCLKPLEAQLMKYQKMVTPEMSDAEVNEIYEQGCRLWCGLPHEIDLLRREYLKESLVE